MANQGILQAQINIKNKIDLNNAFSSDTIQNPLLKSIEGNLNLKDKNSLVHFNGGNNATQHIDPIIYEDSDELDITNALNNNASVKYLKIDANVDPSVTSKFANNSSLEKLDSKETIEAGVSAFENTNLKLIPNVSFNNADQSSVLTNDTNLAPTTLDFRDKDNMTKLGVYGEESDEIDNLQFVKVSTEAPFDHQITPQIDVSYTGLDRNGLVNLFNTMPYNIGYQVIGNPTIVDGVASGFSSSDYVRLNDRLIVEDVSKLKIHTAFTTGNNVNVNQHILGSVNYNSTYGFYIGSNYVRGILAYKDASNNNKYDEIGFYCNTNTSYLIEEEIDLINKTRKLLYSTNGVDWQTVNKDFPADFVSLSITSVLYQIGVSQNFQNGFLGSIDLNNTYIKVNSPVSTGPVDYTVVGSPTISNGIVSFPATGNNHLDVKYIDFDNNDFEFIFIATPGKWPPAGGAILLSFGSGPTAAIGFINSRLWYLAADGYTNPNLIFADQSFQSGNYYYIRFKKDNGILSLGWSLDNQTYTEQTYELQEGDNLHLGNFIQIGYNGYKQSECFYGTIDLNQTYIKINGQPWFGHESKQVTLFNGKPSQIKVLDISGATGTSSLTNDDKAIVTNKGWRLVTDGSNSKNYTIEDGKLTWANPNLYLSGPVNYTIVGSPTIVDNVASGFSLSSYIKTDQIFTGPINQIDICIAVKFKSTTSDNQGLAGPLGNVEGQGFYIQVGASNGRLRWCLSSNGSSWDIVNAVWTDYYLNESSNYKIRLTFDGSIYKLLVSADGADFVLVDSKNSTDKIFANNQPISFGYRQYYTQFWRGSIDLNNTYIKVNDQLWFYGKNYTSTNIAPVPANFSYNNIVTPSIGYVDMRTQEFTEAPIGTKYNFNL